MNPIDVLRGIPAFCNFAHEKMATNPAAYEYESQFGSGIVQTISIAVITIGGDCSD